MGSLFNALFHADGNQVGNRVLFEIDEAWVLNKLNRVQFEIHGSAQWWLWTAAVARRL